MRNIVLVFSFLAILALAVVGILFIFEVTSSQQSLELLMKMEGGILLLGGCSALISALLAGAKKDQQD